LITFIRETYHTSAPLLKWAVKIFFGSPVSSTFRKRSRQEWEQEGNKALLENIGKIALFWQYSLILHYFQKPNNNLEVAGGTLKRM